MRWISLFQVILILFQRLIFEWIFWYGNIHSDQIAILKVKFRFWVRFLTYILVCQCVNPLCFFAWILTFTLNDSISNNNTNQNDNKTNVYKNNIILLLNFIIFAMSLWCDNQIKLEFINKICRFYGDNLSHSRWFSYI